MHTYIHTLIFEILLTAVFLPEVCVAQGWKQDACCSRRCAGQHVDCCDCCASALCKIRSGVADVGICRLVKDKRRKMMFTANLKPFWLAIGLWCRNHHFIPALFHSNVALRHQRPKMKRAFLKQRQRMVASWDACAIAGVPHQANRKLVIV